jgi:hypothetical protein
MAVLRVSVIFTIGAFVLVTNAALSFLPFIGLKSDLPKQIIYVEGILSVVSCSLFLIGSSIAFWESLKATTGKGGYFGWELEDYSSIEPKESKAEKGERGEEAEEEPELPPTHHPQHLNNAHESLFHHEVRGRGQLSRSRSPSPHYARHLDHSHDQMLEDGQISRLQSPPPSYTEAASPEATSTEACYKDPTDAPSWTHVFSAHGFHEMYCNLGLVASAIFLVSSLTYCMTALASFISILSIGEVFRAIRYPQLVAGSGFTIGSLLLLIKTQKDRTGRWWKPALRRLAWHVNLWNLIGSAGFVFCAYFGLLAHVRWSDFQFNCSYLWGSWAFLLGSMIQWYKARHKMKFVKKLDEKRASAQKEKLRIATELNSWRLLEKKYNASSPV